MRVLSLFSGIGAFEVALNEENVEWSLDHFCEIDKYAVQSYNMIHGTTDEDNLKDVTNIDYSTIGDVDLVTYGFPCQDISLAGQQKGFVDEDGNITRSGLFFNAADIIRHTNPKFAIFENVKNLTSKKFKAEFDTVLSTLDELGYNTYWQVLNAKNYGVPQNRERVFGVSIRKDIDHGFKFPDGFPLELRLKDMLEDKVDDKYYLSEKVTERLKITDPTMTKNIVGTTKPDFRTIGQRDAVYQTNGVMGSLVATDYKQPKQILEEPKIQQLGNIVSTGNWDNPQRGRIYSSEGISPALNTCGGGGLEPKIVEEPKVINPLKDKTNNGWHFEQQVYDANGITRTVKAGGGSGNIPKVIEDELSSKRLGGIFDDEKGKHQAGSVWDTDHLSPTLDTMQGGYRQPCVIVPEKTKRGYKEAYEGDGVYINRPHQKRGCVQTDMTPTLKCSCGNDLGVVVKEPTVCEQRTDEGIRFFKDNICGTIRTTNSGGDKRIIENTMIGSTQNQKKTYIEKALDETLAKCDGVPEGLDLYNRRPINDGIAKTLGADCGHNGTAGNMMVSQQLRIRKLTPRECWRLMGFRDKYFDRVKGVSNTQLYKQAGNSIVVDVLRAIVRSFKEQYPEYFYEESDEL